MERAAPTFACCSNPAATLLIPVGETSRKLASCRAQAFFVATIFVILSLPVSLYEIAMHLENFNRPKLQTRIIRILFMVPIYALDRCLCLPRFMYLDSGCCMLPVSGLCMSSVAGPCVCCATCLLTLRAACFSECHARGHTGPAITMSILRFSRSQSLFPGSFLKPGSDPQCAVLVAQPANAALHQCAPVPGSHPRVLRGLRHLQLLHVPHRLPGGASVRQHGFCVRPPPLSPHRLWFTSSLQPFFIYNLFIFLTAYLNVRPLSRPPAFRTPLSQLRQKGTPATAQNLASPAQAVRLRGGGHDFQHQGRHSCGDMSRLVKFLEGLASTHAG